MPKCRMVSEYVIRRDDYLDMPVSARELYVQTVLDADDDGFVGNPRTVLRIVGASADDLRILIARGFLLAFQSGIVAVTHWRQQNKIRSDRYKPTRFTAEKALLVEENHVYRFAYENTESNFTDVGIPDGYQADTNGTPNANHRYAQDKIRKDKIKTREELPPSGVKGAEKPATNVPDDSDLSVFSGELHEAVRDWLEYKLEKRQGYKAVGRKTFLRQVRSKADEFGDAKVAALIRDSIAANYQGVVWDRLERQAAKGGCNDGHRNSSKVGEQDFIAGFKTAD